MRKIKKIALLPNVITAFGLSCGLFVIFKMAMIETDKLDFAALLAVTLILFLAAFSDLIDGAVARAIKAESEFGGVFDALADSISFGVAPAVVVLKSLALLPGSKLSYIATAAAMIFSLSGVLRLARYRVQDALSRLNYLSYKEGLGHFTGLPIPAAAIAAVSLNLLFYAPELESLKLSKLSHTWILSVAMVLLGYCMVSRWKFPSVKALEIKVASFQTLFFTVIAAALIFYGILHHTSLMFVFISWGYIILAFVLSIIRLMAGRNSMTLIEFEPEDEDC